jgi:magnesium transporter
VIVDCAVYENGERREGDLDVADAARAACDASAGFVWLGAYEPTAEEFDAVRREFDLHELAVEDAVKAHQRPKLERYGDSLFLTLKTLWYVDEEDAVETGEINLFVGSDFVITVRHGEGGALRQARSALEDREAVLAHGPSSVVYAVCDQVVDAYEEVAESLQEDVDEVETSVFSDLRTNDSARIYVLKRELAEVRRAVHPLREPVNRFTTGVVRGIHPDAGPYFRDVGDHLSRVSETVEGLDSLLSTAFDAHLAQISIQQNDDMRRISATIGLIAAPALIGAIYGMNFEHMPELGWQFGYPMALLLMAMASLTVWILSKRAGWL